MNESGEEAPAAGLLAPFLEHPCYLFSTLLFTTGRQNIILVEKHPYYLSVIKQKKLGSATVKKEYLLTTQVNSTALKDQLGPSRFLQETVRNLKKN